MRLLSEVLLTSVDAVVAPVMFHRANYGMFSTCTVYLEQLIFRYKMVPGGPTCENSTCEQE
jgi:hypothetical protein